jgi:N utilization substance protein B
MPVLRKLSDPDRLVVARREVDRDVAYRLTAEGERFLTLVLGIAVDCEVGGTDIEWLIDRGWAVREEIETPAAKVPVKTARHAVAARRSETLRSTLTRRTRGREVALQVLYQSEQNPGVDARQLDQFVERRLGDERLIAFTRSLVQGVRDNQQQLDALISAVAENWRIDRMAAIDRNILRLGAFELLHCPDVPRNVAINEALELAKRYSTAQSSRFVNGILDRVQADAPAADAPVAGAPAAEPTSSEAGDAAIEPSG